ncbi:MAG: hypothetical protein ACYDBS_10545, partial [Acidimicrobiales bacterium]
MSPHPTRLGRLVGLGIIVVSLTACSKTTSPAPTSSGSGNPGSTSTRSSHPGSAIGSAAGLKPLPIAGDPSSNYPRLLEATGTGNKALGTVPVGRGQIFVQTVCKGPSALELVKLFAQGPCNNFTGVAQFAAPRS